MAQFFYHQTGDNQISVPFPVCRDDVPGSFRSRRFFNEILVGCLEFIPTIPVIQVIHAEFPKFIRVLKSGFQPFFLFFFGDVQE